MRCPGQDMRRWKPEDIFEIRCPYCDTSMEFFKDEPFLLCQSCKQKVRNPKIDLGCAEWCKFAKQCLGELPQAHGELSTLCDRIIAEMRRIFGDDQRRIQHALKVLAYAEEIQSIEGGDPLTVKAAAILHDIGIHEAERKHGSSAGSFQEIEGLPIARKIMAQVGIDENTIEHVCRIVGSHHSARGIDTPEFRIIWDADQLINLIETGQSMGRKEFSQMLDRVFKTDKGRELARKTLLGRT